MATRRLLGDLLPLCEQATGVQIALSSAGGVEIARRVRAGERFDIVVLAADALEQLATEGHVERGSIRAVAHSATAVAVREGAAGPSSCDAPALRSFVASSRNVGISTGPSGKAVRALLARWGLSEPTVSIVEAPPGVPVASLIGSGACALGFQQLSELAGEPGIRIVGTIPPEVLPLTVFAAAISRSTTNPHAAAVLDALTSPQAASIIERHAMQPPR
ncbi:MAG: substrate-binding domain-containing protein [Gammaproteobacteria bacterium]|nr:substrate-binding domain-containing protein [Gammaproteobacteria bacterium]